jgi:putative transposase
VPGLPHHITQRGNYRQPVFIGDGDRHFFLRRLADHARHYGIDVLAWCLMSNHFHLIAIPWREDSFALGMRALLSEYSLRVNTLRGEIRGHAWQSRFYSCALKRSHLWMALRYVELNPVRANIVARPEQYAWSSARYHLGLARHPPLLSRHEILSHPAEWARWLQAGASPDEETELRQCTLSGRAFGTPPPTRGRPKKEGRSWTEPDFDPKLNGPNSEQ